MASPTLWSFIATFGVPCPLFILVLLNLPVPKPLRRGILRFTSTVFELPLIGVFKTLHVMLFVLAVAFGSALRTLSSFHHQTQAQAPTGAQFLNPNWEVAQLSKRWRSERNMWLSGFAFTLWAMLAAFYREASRRMDLEDRLIEYELSEYNQTMDDSTRDVSREVSSLPAGLTPRSLAPSPTKPARAHADVGAPAAGANASALAAAVADKVEDVATSAPAPELEMVDRFVKKDL